MLILINILYNLKLVFILYIEYIFLSLNVPYLVFENAHYRNSNCITSQ